MGGELELPVRALVQPSAQEDAEGGAGRGRGDAGEANRPPVTSHGDRRVKRNRKADLIGKPHYAGGRAGDSVEGRLRCRHRAVTDGQD